MTSGRTLIVIEGRLRSPWRPEERQDTASAPSPQPAELAILLGAPANDNADDLAPFLDPLAASPERQPPTAGGRDSPCRERCRS